MRILYNFPLQLYFFWLLLVYTYITYVFIFYIIYTMTTTAQTIDTSKWLDYATRPLQQTITTTQPVQKLWTITLYPENILDSEAMHQLEQREKQEKIINDFNKDWYDTGNIALEHITLYSFDNPINNPKYTTSYYHLSSSIMEQLYRHRKWFSVMPTDSENNATLSIEPQKNYMDSKTRKTIIKKLVELKKEFDTIKASNTHRNTKQNKIQKIKKQLHNIQYWLYAIA